jgi:hypothetical protein
VSNVKLARVVPATAATVTVLVRWAERSGAPRHATVVELDQAAVRQRASESCAVCVVSTEPKLRPVTVTEERPVEAAFKNADDTAGVSYVKVSADVPATALTVTNETSSVPYPCTLAWHVTLLMEDHAAVEQCDSAIATELLSTIEPKFRPVTVKESPVEPGKLGMSDLDARGASNVKPVMNVPAMAPTVTESTLEIDVTPRQPHRRVVAEFQLEDPQPQFEIDVVAEKS